MWCLLPTASTPNCFCSGFPFSLQDHAGTGPEKCAASDNVLVNLRLGYQLKGLRIQHPTPLPTRTRGWVNLCHLTQFCQPPTFNTKKTELPLFPKQKSSAIHRHRERELGRFMLQNEQGKSLIFEVFSLLLNLSGWENCKKGLYLETEKAKQKKCACGPPLPVAH